MNRIEATDSAVAGFRDRGFLRELLLTLAAAIWTGLASSMTLILLVFLLAGPDRSAL